jgi:quercetin dioxygenase-like cupin family protein
MAESQRASSLPSVRETGEFEGAEHGSDVSVIVVDAEPGRGPALHHHPYVETFVVQEGSARFEVDGETIEATAGDVVVAPPGAVHGFTTVGPGRTRMVNIHSAPRFETIWVDGGDAP